ncbi:MAG: MarR family winged helix-turn-helix transcriptional regulator [Gemmataceae bacterium]
MPDGLPDVSELAELMTNFGFHYKRYLHDRMQEVETTTARSRLLQVLCCGEAMKMSEVSEHLQVTPRNVTVLVDALEKDKLVLRRPHEHDRRVTLLELTEAGRQAGAKANAAMQAAIAELFMDELTITDRKDMERVLKKLLAALVRRGYGAEQEKT